MLQENKKGTLKSFRSLAEHLLLFSLTFYLNVLYVQGGGESLDQLYRRCTSALQRIARKHIGTVHDSK